MHCIHSPQRVRYLVCMFSRHPNFKQNINLRNFYFFCISPCSMPHNSGIIDTIIFPRFNVHVARSSLWTMFISGISYVSLPLPLYPLMSLIRKPAPSDTSLFCTIPKSFLSDGQHTKPEKMFFLAYYLFSFYIHPFTTQ